MKETIIIEIGLRSVKEIVAEQREWLLGGENFGWEYFIEPFEDHLILRRW